jgi:Na+-driven multidrug efflux pump
VAVVVYAVLAAGIFAFAERAVRLFTDDPTGGTVAVAVPLVSAACLAVVARGVGGTYAGALDGTGDTGRTLYSRVGMGSALPVTYLGATTSLGLSLS